MDDSMMSAVFSGYNRPLPPPRRVAMPEKVWTRRLSGQAPRRLALEQFAGMDVRYIVRTGTWVDVGFWLGPRPVQVVVLPYELALLATGWFIDAPRPLIYRVPLRQLHDSIYNHVTGRLALAPAPDTPVKALRVNPIAGYQLLSQIHHEGA